MVKKAVDTVRLREAKTMLQKGKLEHAFGCRARWVTDKESRNAWFSLVFWHAMEVPLAVCLFRQ